MFGSHLSIAGSMSNALIEADERARDETGRRTDQRLRIGLYSYHAPMPASPQESEES